MGTSPRGVQRPPLARALAIDAPHLELLGRVAWEHVDDVTLKLARELGLRDVANALELLTWSDDQITTERIERGLQGGFHERSGFARYVVKVVFEGLPNPWGPSTIDRASTALAGLLRDEGRVLKAWDPEQEPSFKEYLRRVAATVLDARNQ
jgi:hypothetical protein